jgi:CRISPR/Cas system-associated endonuclease/helicase Cas3
MNIFQLEQESLTILKIKEFLKEINSTYSLKSKEEYVSRLDNFRKVINFTWRKDQKEVIDNFVKYEKDIYVIHAVFGSGKTTLLLGLLIHGIINKLFKPEDIMFISFNICIKNEIKRKLKDYGINSKVQVRTYDSIIYEICKNTGYPYMDLPNFEGKRKHVLNYVYEEGELELKYQPVFQNIQCLFCCGKFIKSVYVL